MNSFFDVGANLGGLSVTLSRLVGPFGKVISFEVSPRIIPQLIANLNHWVCNNVFVVPKAAWNTSGEQIPLYYGGAHYADSVMEGHADFNNGGPSHFADTVALDDIVGAIGSSPSVVKMDIEGAEQEALKGFLNTLDSHHPALILEMDGADASLQQWLAGRGYHLYLADSYEKLEKPVDSRLMNVIAIHQDDTKNNSYYNSIVKTPVLVMDHSSWRADSDGFYFKSPQLQAGRYVLSFVPTQEALYDHSKAELSVLEGERLESKSFHNSPWSHLSQSYTDQPFHLKRDNSITIRLKFSEQKDLNNVFKSMSLLRVDSNQSPWADKKRVVF